MTNQTCMCDFMGQLRLILFYVSIYFKNQNDTLKIQFCSTCKQYIHNL